jgi:serine/threonine protein kinase
VLLAITIAGAALAAVIAAVVVVLRIVQKRRGRQFISLMAEHDSVRDRDDSRSFEPFFLACAREVLSTTQYLPLLEAPELEGMELIGVGSSAKVYRATWRGVTVAVKQLHCPIELSMDTMVTELANEIKLWSQLIHPHIVQFLGVTRELWLIMEFMEHGTLRNVVVRANPATPLHHRIMLMHHVALAMGYLHGRNVVHRDLNPNNVMVTGTETSLEAKLADFGLSRIEAANLSKTSSVGTPVYSAPEVLSRGLYSAKSDVYSFGLTLWFALNREEPFANLKNPFELVRAVSVEKRRPPVGLVPDLRDLVESCWTEDPATRPDFELISSVIKDYLSYESKCPPATYSTPSISGLSNIRPRGASSGIPSAPRLLTSESLPKPSPTVSSSLH